MNTEPRHLSPEGAAEWLLDRNEQLSTRLLTAYASLRTAHRDAAQARERLAATLRSTP